MYIKQFRSSMSFTSRIEEIFDVNAKTHAKIHCSSCRFSDVFSLVVKPLHILKYS